MERDTPAMIGALETNVMPVHTVTAVRSAAVLLVFIGLMGVGSPLARAGELASAWTTDKTDTKSRLSVGKNAGKVIAAVEIQLSAGWKTYWRFPGDGGGVPPTFDFEKSTNVASATVMYPTPTRMSDKAGDTLGYKGGVIFPVAVEPKDASKPAVLVIALDYGICRDLCVPVEASLTLNIPPADLPDVSDAVGAALSAVPRPVDARKPTDPVLLRAESQLEGAKPTLTIEAEFPGGTTQADAFVWSPSGFYIPLPKSKSAVAIGTNQLRFEIDLTGAVDPADIKGKMATVTLVSSTGASEATFTLK
jgi:DsbC/DsbD-like thiol-disulfide interchange protein